MSLRPFDYTPSFLYKLRYDYFNKGATGKFPLRSHLGRRCVHQRRFER